MSVSSDASYDHRRKGSWCFSYILEDNVCVVFSTIGKAGGKREYGTFILSSKMMETTAFRATMDNMIGNLNDKYGLFSMELPTIYIIH